MAEPFSYEEHELTLADIKAILEGFERQYGLSSRDFYEKWKKGETDWVADSVPWSDLFELYSSLNGQNGKIKEK